MVGHSGTRIPPVGAWVRDPVAVLGFEMKVEIFSWGLIWGAIERVLGGQCGRLMCVCVCVFGTRLMLLVHL